MHPGQLMSRLAAVVTLTDPSEHMSGYRPETVCWSSPSKRSMFAGCAEVDHRLEHASHLPLTMTPIHWQSAGYRGNNPTECDRFLDAFSVLGKRSAAAHREWGFRRLNSRHTFEMPGSNGAFWHCTPKPTLKMCS